MNHRKNDFARRKPSYTGRFLSWNGIDNVCGINQIYPRQRGTIHNWYPIPESRVGIRWIYQWTLRVLGYAPLAPTNTNLFLSI